MIATRKLTQKESLRYLINAEYRAELGVSTGEICLDLVFEKNAVPWGALGPDTIDLMAAVGSLEVEWPNVDFRERVNEEQMAFFDKFMQFPKWVNLRKFEVYIVEIYKTCSLADRMPNLVSLAMSVLDYSGINALTQLEELTLTFLGPITIPLTNLTRLKYLSLHPCIPRDVRPLGVFPSVVKFEGRNAYCNPDFTAVIAQLCPNVENFILPDAISDDLRNLLKCPKLKSLRFPTSILPTFPPLEKLDEIWFEFDHEEDFSEVFRHLRHKAQFFDAKSLVFESYDEEPFNFSFLKSVNKRLETLKFLECNLENLPSLATLNLPNLKTIEIEKCGDLTMTLFKLKLPQVEIIVDGLLVSSEIKSRE